MSAPSPVSPGFSGEASLATWLARIVLSEAKARLRRRPRPSISGGQRDAGGSRGVARQEIGRAIEQAVDALPAAFRSVFILRAHERP
jgi:RNA polymerase sigma-70 factor (ECF subfamily)